MHCIFIHSCAQPNGVAQNAELVLVLDQAQAHDEPGGWLPRDSLVSQSREILAGKNGGVVGLESDGGCSSGADNPSGSFQQCALSDDDMSASHLLPGLLGVAAVGEEHRASVENEQQSIAAGVTA